MLTERFGLPAYLRNDADACAVAEWQFGAGKGAENMIFLTFGTGIGAGLILNGKLYEGTCGLAGEIGHVRLFEDGHVGYGKSGSYEGYVSGGGIAQYGKGTAAELGKRAEEGDPETLQIWAQTGEHLGSMLAILIDRFKSGGDRHRKYFRPGGEVSESFHGRKDPERSTETGRRDLPDRSGGTRGINRRYRGTLCRHEPVKNENAGICGETTKRM